MFFYHGQLFKKSLGYTVIKTDRPRINSILYLTHQKKQYYGTTNVGTCLTLKTRIPYFHSMRSKQSEPLRASGKSQPAGLE